MFLTLWHNGGGSMVEAADAEYVLGPYDTLEEAEEAGEEVYERCKHIPYVLIDCWFTVVEIPASPVAVDKMVAEIEAENLR